jgi:hypothetical protein
MGEQSTPLLGNLEGGSFTRDFERWLKRALEVEYLSLTGSSFPGDPGGCVKEGSGDEHLSP